MFPPSFALAAETGVLKGSMEDVVVVLGALGYSAVIMGLIVVFRTYRRRTRNAVQDPYEQDYNTW